MSNCSTQQQGIFIEKSPFHSLTHISIKIKKKKEYSLDYEELDFLKKFKNKKK